MGRIIKKGKVVENIIFAIGCAVFYALIVELFLIAPRFKAAIARKKDEEAMKDTVVKLYEGPRSLVTATDADLEKTAENKRDITLKKCGDTFVSVNGKQCFVYDTNVNNTHTWITTYTPAIERTPITYFDFEGMVRIEITVPDKDVESVTVRPLAYGIEPEVSKDRHTVTFTIDTPDAYTVEWNGAVERAVHIFANLIETDIPDFSDPDVKYIGPGEWDIGDIVLEDNQTLYISGGAVVHGTVCANFAKNVKICGRGILDGSFYAGWKGQSAHVPISFNNCQYITLKDIICLNSNAWGLQCYDVVGGEVSGLKMITARPNGDGLSIQSCKSMKLHDCFVRSWDDSLVVKNYDVSSSKVSFENIQIWTDLAQSMEIGFETNKGKKNNSTITDISFKDITVLHNFHKPVISIHNGDDAAVSGITYENIVVEDASLGRGDGVNDLMEIQVLYNSGWSSTKERGNISDVTIDGLKELSGNETTKCVIEGYDSIHTVSNLSIRNFEYCGEPVTSSDHRFFKVEAQTVSGFNVE